MKVTFSSDRTQSLSSQLPTELELSQDQDLDLSKNALGKRSQEDLIDMIHKLPVSVTSVNMSATGLQLKSGADIAAIIVAFKFTQVRSLDLSVNWLGMKKSASELELIMAAFQETELAEVNFAGNNLGNLKVSELKTILDILNKSNLKTINVSSNQFDRAGGAYEIADVLFTALARKVALESIDTFTQIVVEHMQKLYEASDDYIKKFKLGFFSEAPGSEPDVSDPKLSDESNVTTQYM